MSKEVVSFYNEDEVDSLNRFIYPSLHPILKILYTNQCREQCKYCTNNLYSNIHRYTLKGEDFCKKFLYLWRTKKVHGLFISSAIYKNSDFSQEIILKTILNLRKKYSYPGYIHAKILPHSDLDLIQEIVKYADRVSINLESPCQKYLSCVSEKNLWDDLMYRLRYLSYLNQEKNFKGGVTTQFVVGLGETDRDLLHMSEYLYRKLKLKRVYYSGLHLTKETQLLKFTPPSELRIRLLYQADFLVRDYGFSYQELPYDSKGNLVRGRDLKESYAQFHPHIFPVNLNFKGIEDLIRVPGIGKVTAKRIIEYRRENRIKSQYDLEKLKVPKKSYKWICW